MGVLSTWHSALGLNPSSCSSSSLSESSRSSHSDTSMGSHASYRKQRIHKVENDILYSLNRHLAKGEEKQDDGRKRCRNFMLLSSVSFSVQILRFLASHSIEVRQWRLLTGNTSALHTMNTSSIGYTAAFSLIASTVSLTTWRILNKRKWVTSDSEYLRCLVTGLAAGLVNTWNQKALLTVLVHDPMPISIQDWMRAFIPTCLLVSSGYFVKKQLAQYILSLFEYRSDTHQNQTKDSNSDCMLDMKAPTDCKDIAAFSYPSMVAAQLASIIAKALLLPVEASLLLWLIPSLSSQSSSLHLPSLSWKVDCVGEFFKNAALEGLVGLGCLDLTWLLWRFT